MSRILNACREWTPADIMAAIDYKCIQGGLHPRTFEGFVIPLQAVYIEFNGDASQLRVLNASHLPSGEEDDPEEDDPEVICTHDCCECNDTGRLVSGNGLCTACDRGAKIQERREQEELEQLDSRRYSRQVNEFLQTTNRWPDHIRQQIQLSHFGCFNTNERETVLADLRTRSEFRSCNKCKSLGFLMSTVGSMEACSECAETVAASEPAESTASA
jgi:hypothetical protein